MKLLSPASLSVLVLALCLSGCDTKAPAGAVSDGATVAKPTVPPELMTAAYHWYGLSRTAPVDLVLRKTGDPSVATGSITSQLKSVTADQALFSITRTGKLKDELGDEEVTLKKDGIWDTSNSKGTLSKPSMELPSEPAVGNTWRMDSTLKTTETMDSTTKPTETVIRQLLTAKVAAIKPTVVDGKNVDMLVVTATGTVTIGASKPAKIVATSYYVKDLGMIKNEIWVTPKGQKVVKMTMERPTGGDKR